MSRSRSKNALTVLFPFCMVLAVCLSALGQSRYNSPEPFLLSLLDIDAPPAAGLNGTAAFAPGTSVDLYVENIGSSMMKGEGANAFKLYAADKQGRIYSFRAVSVLKAAELNKKGEPVKPGDGPTAQVSPYFSPDRNRLMQQATFGYTVALNGYIRLKGIATYVNEQIETPVTPPGFAAHALKPSAPPADCNKLEPPVDDPPDSPANCYRDTYTLYPLQKWFFTEAFYGDAQLRNRVAWALSQIWVTSGVEIRQSRHMTEYYKILYENAFGNYKTLMGKMTLNPAMGDYLDMSVSTATSPNENYPRELMQLFTLGTFELNQDGTLKCVVNNPCGPNDTPIPTYDQTDVNNFSKVFTGWTFCTADCDDGLPSGDHGLVVGAVNFIAKMKVNPLNHDKTVKTLLDYPGSTTTTINSCTQCNSQAVTAYANASLEQALTNIYDHPNVAPFVCKQLIQHLVQSKPSDAYVGRISAVFNANRASSTQMKEVIRAILLDPEARGDVKSDPMYGKLREPVQFATNILRSLNVKGIGFVQTSDGVIFRDPKFEKMSQRPFYSGSVFNYYSPKNVILIPDPNPNNPPVDLLAPEFGLMTPTTAVSRPNFANMMLTTGIMVSEPDRPYGTAVDISEFENAAMQDPTGNLLLDLLNQRFLHGTMTTAMRNSILGSLPASDALARATQATYLVVTSSQFQVQR
jgi:uncharacterized protein (DUF1800 family)